MYKRIIYDTALDWVPYVAFAVTAAIFVTFTARAIRLRQEQADHLAHLPLDD